jgi:hypothetical protein
MLLRLIVMPAHARIQPSGVYLDSRVRGNDTHCTMQVVMLLLAFAPISELIFFRCFLPSVILRRVLELLHAADAEMLIDTRRRAEQERWALAE